MRGRSALVMLLVFAVPAYGQLIDPNRRCQVQPNGDCTPLPVQPGPYGNPGPGQGPQVPAEPSGTFMYCNSTKPVRNTRNMFVSNVFRSDQDVNTVAGQFEAYEDKQGTSTYFVCHSGTYSAMQRSLQQNTISLATRGYSVTQVRHR